MINDKLITITRENKLDVSWVLFTPFKIRRYRRPALNFIGVSDIVRAITKSERVSIILSEKCLASAITRELQWVNQYIKIHIIAKSQDIVNSYKPLSFASVKIDPSIDFNYLSIGGKNPLYVMINDDYAYSSPLLREIYFDKKDKLGDYSCLEGMDHIMLVGGAYSEYKFLLGECEKRGIKSYRVVNQRDYTREIYDSFSKEKSIPLLSTFTRDIALGFDNDGKIYKIFKAENGFILTTPIERLDDFIGELYSFPSDKACPYLYAWSTKGMKPVKMVDKLVFDYVVHAETMQDFIDERFDRSIADNNDCKELSRLVEYRYTLVPPLRTFEYRISSEYDPIVNLKKKYNKTLNDHLSRLESEMSDFTDQRELIVSLCEIDHFALWLVNAVSNCDYRGYYAKCNSAFQLLKNVKEKLLLYCEKMFMDIHGEVNDTKLDIFDKEIESYQKIISEKEDLIKEGRDVSNSKRRIDILQGKINDLLALKKKFQSGASSRENKDLQAFLKKCEGIMAGQRTMKTSDESISRVLEKTEKTKATKLNLFVENHLCSINKALDKYISLVEELLNIEILEDYQLLERNGQGYIVINDIEEYEKTREIREKFKLLCLARR